MAFAKTGKVNGDDTVYELRDNVKRFTLRDLGFIEGKTGVFSLEKSLDPTSLYNANYKFKMKVDKDLSGFRMAITTGNGLEKVNIFKNPDTQPSVEQYQFIINDLIDRDVLKRRV
ncbi:DUF1831 domain-containing protein [Lentilactobacillus buchneri]|uniref:DUF1831 domain-containing protein n=1 Tax=Lentilactobacillus buchneri TaxID=1581 RepID=UPI0010ABF65E|nr:DUF1831 domain-containing protein [Lentilactobacillus buchneri]TJX99823.1 cysteine desulfurase [Lentilactobacillus buchneri]TJY05341.1 cysteine desulfurase [Lentilactobacillus buchneri]TJY09653.1 cysteine desulfurase [Lentilactobacillus buchneri]TJY16230.1 cysteine desulfurase [Lentilactobacillus buchneri]TJY20286.1 cysteine desulfurase [Lentilactobacillus buchneri]